MPLILGANSVRGTAVHTIDQSIRFNDDDTAHMTRTFGSGNQKVWTMSFWVKRANLGTGQRIISRRTGGGSTTATMGFRVTTDQFDFYDPSNGGQLITDAVFRDSSAWYNFVINYEASNSAQAERLRIYVNGTRQTFTTNVAISDANGNFNAAVVHAIGKYQYNNTEYLDGYLAEIVWIDGTALDPSSFAEENENGIWIPKDVSSLSFGTNGFHLKGESASDLGNDSSGNNNDFTTSGLASHDQVLDSPSNNFSTLSTINMGSATGVTLKNGNLEGTTSGTAGNAPASISLDSGKWYYELNVHAAGSGLNGGAGETPTGSFHHFTLGSNGNQINANGEDRAFSSGNIVGFKLDIDGGTLEYTTDGSSYSTVEGSLTANTAYAPYMRLGSSSGRGVFNFGQDSTFGGLETSGSANASDDNGVGDFYYSVPSGFLAICTKNLGS